eukprot:5326843-Pleurochrysis_carterae.AAC.3
MALRVTAEGLARMRWRNGARQKRTAEGARRKGGRERGCEESRRAGKQESRKAGKQEGRKAGKGDGKSAGEERTMLRETERGGWMDGWSSDRADEQRAVRDKGMEGWRDDEGAYACVRDGKEGGQRDGSAGRAMPTEPTSK